MRAGISFPGAGAGRPGPARLLEAVLIRVVRVLAVGTAPRVNLWNLLADLLGNSFGLREALALAITANRRNALLRHVLQRWQFAHAGGAAAFVSELSRWAPASEALIFYGMERVPPEDLFRAAARVAEVRARQMRAIMAALAWPVAIFATVLFMVWYIGGYVMPVMREATDPSGWPAWVHATDALAAAFYRYDWAFGLGFLAAAAAVWVAVLRWTGPGRRRLDLVAPFSLYRIVSGSAFILVILEFLRLRVDLTERTWERLSLGASPYVRSRIRAVRVQMVRGGLGFGRALDAAGTGFPDETLVTVAAALDGRPDWEAQLRGFTDRWIDRSGAVMAAAAMVLNAVLTIVATVVTLAVLSMVFKVFSQVDAF